VNPPGSSSAAATRPALNLEIAEALEATPLGAVDYSSWTIAMIPPMRAAMAPMLEAIEVPPTTTVSHVVSVSGGEFQLPLRVYSPPTKQGARACIYWMHGGGFILGSGLLVDARLNSWVEEMDCVVVSVDYRLAPEHPYPTPLEDCYNGLLWTVDHASELGVDPSRIILAGASAGGGLAAALALLARDRGSIRPAFQLLIYPMLDDRNVHHASGGTVAPVWDHDANRLGWRAYLDRLADTDQVPATAAPARAEDLAGLPPAWIGVGSVDIFRDENVTYARRLLAANVVTALHVYPGAPHGFEMFAPDSAIGRACQRDIAEALKSAIG
jgi:acetyl esterase/lipase